MQVMLRQRAGRLYFTGFDGTTRAQHLSGDPERGFNFQSVKIAAMTAFKHHLADTEIVVRYEHLEEEVVLPLLVEWCECDDQDRHPLTSRVNDWQEQSAAVSLRGG